MQLNDIKNKRIFYAVLNWGLGHATRSACVIKQLLANNNQPIIFSSGQALSYLEKEFPQLQLIDLESRPIVYPKHNQLWITLLMQQKKIFGTIKNENSLLNYYVDKGYVPDLIISDNCYGFYHKKIPSIILTHQLNIKTPFLELPAQKKIWRLLKNFSCIWIPDVAGDENLSGELSRPILADKPCVFIGPLSNLTKTTEHALLYAYCAVISGPEKQRTVFENHVIDFLRLQQQPCMLVRGSKTHNRKLQTLPATTKVLDFAQGHALANIMQQSDCIISRSGYSTIMDLYVLQKKCILVPTPGQTEQEYLYLKHFNKKYINIDHIPPKQIALCNG